MKRFNTTGICFPDKHYMVDISERIALIRRMIDRGDYFCINRGRQYGKSTTLYSLKKHLDREYVVFSLSFEVLGDEAFESESSLAYWFIWLINKAIKRNLIKGIDDDSAEAVSRVAEGAKSLSIPECSDLLQDICSRQKIVLLIDEVDQASNHISFIKFLGMLRAMYLEREDVQTFQSVILAGVYDVKNLKLKMRPNDEHQYNSPWNIAVPFDADMTLSAAGIAGMLAEYKSDHSLNFDEVAVAQEIRDYTGGYPFLVSKICQIIDEKSVSWCHDAIVNAVHDILSEHNTLFDDLSKKLNDFPKLNKLLKNILYVGERKNVSIDDETVQFGVRFGFVSYSNGTIAIDNKIFKLFLEQLFDTEKQIKSIC